MCAEQLPSEVVLAAIRATEKLLRKNFLLSDVTAEEFNEVAAIITRCLAATPEFAQGVSEMREKAMQIAESYCEDIPQHVDVTLDRNSFAAGYLCAAGGIRQALSRTITAAATADNEGEESHLDEYQRKGLELLRGLHSSYDWRVKGNQVIGTLKPHPTAALRTQEGGGK